MLSPEKIHSWGLIASKTQNSPTAYLSQRERRSPQEEWKKWWCQQGHIHDLNSLKHQKIWLKAFQWSLPSVDNYSKDSLQWANRGDISISGMERYLYNFLPKPPSKSDSSFIELLKVRLFLHEHIDMHKW